MNWCGKYVIEPNGMIHWIEGMRVHDPALVEAFQNQPVIGLHAGDVQRVWRRHRRSMNVSVSEA